MPRFKVIGRRLCKVRGLSGTLSICTPLESCTPPNFAHGSDPRLLLAARSCARIVLAREPPAVKPASVPSPRNHALDTGTTDGHRGSWRSSRHRPHRPFGCPANLRRNLATITCASAPRENPLQFRQTRLMKRGRHCRSKRQYMRGSLPSCAARSRLTQR